MFCSLNWFERKKLSRYKFNIYAKIQWKWLLFHVNWHNRERMKLELQNSQRVSLTTSRWRFSSISSVRYISVLGQFIFAPRIVIFPAFICIYCILLSIISNSISAFTFVFHTWWSRLIISDYFVAIECQFGTEELMNN